MIDLVDAVEDRLIVRLVYSVDTGVIRSALHIRRGELSRKYLLQERDVLFHQLFLQVLGTGRYYDPAVVLDRRGDGRDEIRERLAGTGSGLDDKVLFFFKGNGDSVCHTHLALAVFIVLMKLRDQAAGSEYLVIR